MQCCAMLGHATHQLSTGTQSSSSLGSPSQQRSHPRRVQTGQQDPLPRGQPVPRAQWEGPGCPQADRACDNSADMMVMAESQGLAAVSLCLPLCCPRGHWNSVLVAPRPKWWEAGDGVGTSVCPVHPQTPVEGGRGWYGDICDPHADHHPPPQTKPDPRQLSVLTAMSPLSTDRAPHAAALRGRGEGHNGETPAEARRDQREGG